MHQILIKDTVQHGLMLEYIADAAILGDGPALPVDEYLSYAKEHSIDIPLHEYNLRFLGVRYPSLNLWSSAMESFRDYMAKSYPNTWSRLEELDNKSVDILNELARRYMHDKDSLAAYRQEMSGTLDERKRYCIKTALIYHYILLYPSLSPS